MTTLHQSRIHRERQLDVIISHYYHGADQGAPPNQEALIAQHPEFASELQEFFADLASFYAMQPSDESDLYSHEISLLSRVRNERLSPKAAVHYFGEYEILDELGIGGMGVVFKAHHKQLRKIVALKMIRAGELASAQDVQRFRMEAQANARLSHPGIVAVHEVGIHQQLHFLTMDYVDGGSLSQLCREEPVPARRAADLLRQVAEAMHYAHGEGIIHRDLKPANILLTKNGTPRITDFGLAKHLRTSGDSIEPALTEAGQIVGTAGYMSPEQASGKNSLVGPSADIYSLGALLYALLTGRAPFVGETASHTILQVLNQEPVSPRRLNPQIPGDLETICMHCLMKGSHQRYGTAQLLAEDLTRFLEGRPVKARPVGATERSWRWCRRNQVVPTLVLTNLASLITGIVLSSSASWHSGERADAESLFATRDPTARQSAELSRWETEDTEQPTDYLPFCTQESVINSRHIANFENSTPDSFQNDAKP